jgi:hypothetical protein
VVLQLQVTAEGKKSALPFKNIHSENCWHQQQSPCMLVEEKFFNLPDANRSTAASGCPRNFPAQLTELIFPPNNFWLLAFSKLQ